MSKITKEYIQKLSKKWLEGTITDREKREFDAWYSSFEDNEVDDLTEEDLLYLRDKIYNSIKENKRLGERSEDIGSHKRTLSKRKWLIVLAACISVFVLLGVVFYVTSHKKSDDNYAVIKPGRDQAILSFENGLAFNLDSLDSGEILQDKGTRIEKTENGALAYSTTRNSVSRDEVFKNTVTIPRGGQYKIQLPDGSRIWLNAESKLTFPSHFIGDTRIVELAGEAYFEVVEDQNKPFKVLTEKGMVEVLGTSFNVSSYANEAVATTLLEGSVRLSTFEDTVSGTKVLEPGQQGIFTSSAISIQEVNTQEVTAWKDGEFMFNNEDIRSVMRKIARWYDVEVVYAPDIPNVPIWGSISKYEDITKVLGVIELTEAANFKIIERRVYVMK